MPRKFPNPGGSDRIVTCVAVFLIGIFSLVAWWKGNTYVRLHGTPVHLLLPGALLVMGSTLLWFRIGWARVPVAGILGLFGLIKVAGLVLTAFDWKEALYAASFCGGGWQVWRLFSPAKLAEQEAEESRETKPMTSVVLLLRRARFLDSKGVAAYLKAAWGQEFHAAEGDEDETKDRSGPESYVVGQSPIFMVGTPQGMFIVHNHDRTYFDDQEELAEEQNEMRRRKVLAETRAWISVDYMAGDFADRKEAYPWIAKAIAEMAGPDAVGIFLPEEHRLIPWDEELEQKLKGTDVFELFQTTHQAPVVNVEADNERMLAAVAEARRRWPEFVDAFNRKDGDGFSVKAPITRGKNTEHIWIDVEFVSEVSVGGRLGNDPVDLDGLRLGSRVQIPVEEIEDWAVIKGEAHLGLFSLPVLSDAYKDEATGENDPAKS